MCRCEVLSPRQEEEETGPWRIEGEGRETAQETGKGSRYLGQHNTIHHLYLGFEENGEEDSVTEAAGGVRGSDLSAPGAGGQTAGRGGLQPGGGGQGPQHEGLGPPLLHQVH